MLRFATVGSCPALCSGSGDGVVVGAAAVVPSSSLSARLLRLSAAISFFNSAITGANRSAFKLFRRRRNRFRAARAIPSITLWNTQASHTWRPCGRPGCRLRSRLNSSFGFLSLQAAHVHDCHVLLQHS